MKTYSLSALMVLCITSISFFAFTSATTLAHAGMLRSAPAAGDVLDSSPAEVWVWFSEQLSTGSHLSVIDPQFQPMNAGETFIDASDATLMRIKLQPLPPGRYTVNWKANSVDGHETSGSYDFYIKEPPGIPALLSVGVGLVIAAILLLLLVNWIANRLRLRRVIGKR